jgi:hypothetical protein
MRAPCQQHRDLEGEGDRSGAVRHP